MPGAPKGTHPAPAAAGERVDPKPEPRHSASNPADGAAGTLPLIRESTGDQLPPCGCKGIQPKGGRASRLPSEEQEPSAYQDQEDSQGQGRASKGKGAKEGKTGLSAPEDAYNRGKHFDTEST